MSLQQSDQEILTQGYLNSIKRLLITWEHSVTFFFTQHASAFNSHQNCLDVFL